MQILSFRFMLKAVFMMSAALGALSGCRASTEPHLVMPRVFDSETYTAEVSIYPGEPAGKLEPIGAAVYQNWQKQNFTGRFENIGTPDQPRWKLTISPAGSLNSPEDNRYVTREPGSQFSNARSDSARPAAGKSLNTVPAYPAVGDAHFFPAYRFHFAKRELLIVMRYIGKEFSISVPLNYREVEIYCAPSPALRWVTGSERVSKTWSLGK